MDILLEGTHSPKKSSDLFRRPQPPPPHGSSVVVREIFDFVVVAAVIVAILGVVFAAVVRGVVLGAVVLQFFVKFQPAKLRVCMLSLRLCLNAQHRYLLLCARKTFLNFRRLITSSERVAIVSTPSKFKVTRLSSPVLGRVVNDVLARFLQKISELMTRIKHTQQKVNKTYSLSFTKRNVALKFTKTQCNK